MMLSQQLCEKPDVTLGHKIEFEANRLMGNK